VIQCNIRDITARKLSEKALLKSMQAVEASRAQYEQVVSMISDIVWRYEVNNQGQFVSSYISPVRSKCLACRQASLNTASTIFCLCPP